MRFLFTCGGTAGHINPALGIAGRIKELMPDAEILFVGALGNMEIELVGREGFEIKTVRITNLKRSLKPEGIAHNIKTLKNVITAQEEAKRIIKDFRPDVAVGTGGYVCYPVLKAAARLHIPTVIHESNAVPGLTTKMLCGTVDRILLGFEDAKGSYKMPGKTVLTGTPVRNSFIEMDKAQAKAELGISRDKPLVVSVWGSLGADHMNELMVDFVARACRDPRFHFIHSAGKRGYAAIRDKLKANGNTDCESNGIEIREYIYDMPRVMAAADLVICRSGASTLSELGIMGKPAILVPSPNVTGNHQEINARLLEKKGAAIVLLENEFTSSGLFGVVSGLLSKPAKLNEMAEKMKMLGIHDSTDRIIDILLGLKKA